MRDRKEKDVKHRIEKLKKSLFESEIAVRVLLDRSLKISREYAKRNININPEIIFSALISLSDINAMREGLMAKYQETILKGSFITAILILSVFLILQIV